MVKHKTHDYSIMSPIAIIPNRRVTTLKSSLKLLIVFFIKVLFHYVCLLITYLARLRIYKIIAKTPNNEFIIYILLIFFLSGALVLAKLYLKFSPFLKTQIWMFTRNYMLQKRKIVSISVFMFFNTILS